jgi:hypothetical protein
MQIITTLNAILTEKGISVLRFSKETGIPEGRVYKWLDAKTPAKPKSEDVEKIEKWISSKKLAPRQDQADEAMIYNFNTTSEAGTKIAKPSENQPSGSLAETVKIQAEVIRDLWAENNRLRAEKPKKS